MSLSGENMVLGKWLLLPLDESDGDVFGQIDSSGRPGNFHLTHEGEWRLDTMGALGGDTPWDAIGQPPSPDIDTIYGRCADGSLRSLFGCIRHSSSLKLGQGVAQETWGGQWWGESVTHLVVPSDCVDLVELRFECLADWAGGGEAHAGEHLVACLDRESRTFTMPDPIHHEAAGAEYRIVLSRDISARVGVAHFSAEKDASITVFAESRLDRVYDDWVKPIRSLLAFLTLEPVEVPKAVCRLSDAEDMPPPREPLVELRFSALDRERPARSDDTVSNRLEMLATLGQLQAKGLDLNRLLRNFLPLHHSEHATAISYINDVNSGRLDRSVDSKLLHTIKALEIYCKQKGIPENLADQIGFCVERAGATGAEIAGLWEARRDGRRLPSTVNSARTRVAHGQPPGNADQRWDLYCHYVSLTWIARHLYLLEMGLTEADTADIMGQCDPFQSDKDTLKHFIR
ncbi:MAG: hypothetical protein F4067_12305 [Acidimicrobiia bacterium]|nr:hypothetical protein [Acidimicrobiia bacterium]